MEVGAIDKVKYYVLQVDALLSEGVDRVLLRLEEMGSDYHDLISAAEKSSRRRAGSLKSTGLDLDDLGEFGTCLFWRQHF